MTHRLKRIHTLMKALKDKEASGPKLTQTEQDEFDRLNSDYHELLTDTFFHTY
jgi:hypothetical protein